MKKQELYYIANYRLPTDRAHGLQGMQMCSAFADTGVAVTLLAPLRSAESASLFEYYRMPKKFEIGFLSVWNLTGVIPYLGFWIQSCTFAVNVVRYVRAHRYTGVLYSRDQFSLFILSWFIRNPMVYEIHSLTDRILPMHRRVFRSASKIVAISGGLRDALVKAGVPKEKIVVAHDAVDPAFFERRGDKQPLRRSYDLPGDKRVVLYTGSLMSWKGVYTLVDAAQFLPADYAVVLVGGTAVDRLRLQKYAAGQKLNVVIRESLRHDQMPALMAAADVLVIPNSAKDPIGSSYTSPLKFFEYLASPNPIVASDVPSLREIGGSQQGVTYCVPDDPKALAASIMAIRAGASFIRDMSDYTWQRRAEYILGELW